MTEEPPAGKGKGTIIVVVSLIVVVAVFAALLSLGGKDEGKVKYNGFDFVNVNGLWQTTWQRDGQPYELYFRFNPKEVEDIPVTGKTDIRFQLETIYLTVDPSEERTQGTAYLTLAAVELSRKLVDPFERNVTAACTRNETDACIDRTIITCENTNSSVIYLRQADDSKIILNGNCAVIQGKGEEIVRSADKALFQWLGIMS